MLSYPLAAARDACREGVLASVIAVVRADDAAAAALAREAGAQVVGNAAADEGLAGSVRLGLAAAAEAGAEAAAILLGDQPLVRVDVLRALRDAWAAGASAVRPRYLDAPDEPGHPLLLDRTLWPLADALSGDAGLGPALRAAAVPLALVDVPGRNPDIDTPADLAALEEMP